MRKQFLNAFIFRSLQEKIDYRIPGTLNLDGASRFDNLKIFIKNTFYSLYSRQNFIERKGIKLNCFLDDKKSTMKKNFENISHFFKISFYKYRLKEIL